MIKKIGNFIGLVFLMLILIIDPVFGLEATISINPEHPLAGENFNLIFNIKSNSNTSNENPTISFDPDEAEVLGRENTGLSTATTMINGKFTTSKEVVVVYDLMVNRPKKLNITDIKIESGGQTIRLKDFQVNVVSEEKRERNQDVFLMAVASKKKVYLGEGFNVDYYLYYRVPVGSQEIIEFPKLNNFTKRFQNPTDQGERVIYNGETYVRAKRYSARLFATAPGLQYVDSIKLKVQYSNSDQNSPFSGFGLSLRQYRSINLQSKKLEIEVLPIPLAGRPQNFSGLVGEHQVKLNVNENKFLVNQPIEFSLEISGEGMLESLEAPSILEHNNLENFDIKSDFEEQGMVLARKKFEYTFLPRGPLKSEEKDLEISIFNPTLSKFEIIKVKIPEIIVEGEISKGSSLDNIKEENNFKIENKEILSQALRPSLKPLELLPLFPASQNLFVYDLNFLQKVFIIINIILICSLFSSLGFQKAFKSSELNLSFSEIYKKGVSYSRLFIIFNDLAEKNQIKSAGIQEVKDIIKELNLSSSAKKYFCTLVDGLEKSTFEGTGIKVETKIEKKYFKELEKLTRKT